MSTFEQGEAIRSVLVGVFGEGAASGLAGHTWSLFTGWLLGLLLETKHATGMTGLSLRPRVRGDRGRTRLMLVSSAASVVLSFVWGGPLVARMLESAG